MPRMVDNGVTKLYWVAGEAGIADISAPTTTELDAGVDITDIVMSTYEVRADASDTTNERSVRQTANVVVPTIQNYMGNLPMFRDLIVETGVPETTDPLNTFEYKGVGYFVRRLGAPSTQAWAADDVVEVYKFTVDTPQVQGGTGEGFLKVTVPLLPTGDFDTQAVVAAGV